MGNWDSKLKYLINKNKSAEEICRILNISIFELYEIVNELWQKGENYCIANGIPQKISNNINDVNSYQITENVNSFCLLSDIHYGSKKDRVDIMNDIYEKCENKGIKHIFCVGDFTDGNYYKVNGIVQEKKVNSFKEMKQYVIENHPYSDNINFYTISGNHDDTFKLNDERDICKEIADVREDIIYLDSKIANIYLGLVKLRLDHGIKYSELPINKRLIRYFCEIPDYDKPDILALGHIHRSGVVKLEDSTLFQLSTIMDPLRKCYKDFDQSALYIDLKKDSDGNLKKLEYVKKNYK